MASHRDEPYRDGYNWIKIDFTKDVNRSTSAVSLTNEPYIESASFLRTYLNGTNFTTLLNNDGGLLLTYDADDLRYGLVEYLPNMMFRGNSTQATVMIKDQLAISPSMAFSLLQWAWKVVWKRE